MIRSSQPAQGTSNLDAAVSDAVQAIAATIRDHQVTCDHLVGLLVAAGRLPSTTAERRQPQSQMLVAATLLRFTSILEGLLDVVVTQAIEEDDQHLVEIRRFFLEPQETYSMQELAALWHISIDDVRDVYHDEIARWEESNGREGIETNKALRIKWAKAVHTTAIFSLLRPSDIERALGHDFMNVRTERWRTVPILIRLPRFIANAFELDGSLPPKLALAHRIEQVLMEFFTAENLTGNATDEVH